eukprot:7275826-Karenia_brevis.AAC.1
MDMLRGILDSKEKELQKMEQRHALDLKQADDTLQYLSAQIKDLAASQTPPAPPSQPPAASLDGMNVQPGDLQKLLQSLNGIMAAAQATDPAQVISQMQGPMQELQPLLTHTFAHLNPAMAQQQTPQQHTQSSSQPSQASSAAAGVGIMPPEMPTQGAVRKEPPVSPEVSVPASKIQKP